MVVIVCIVAYNNIHDELKDSKSKPKNKKTLTEYDEALEKFKNDGFYNFKISMEYSEANLLFYINSSGKISIYRYENNDYSEVRFSNTESGKKLQENIKNIFIEVAFYNKFKITPQIYERLSGDVVVKYEDNIKIYSSTWSNPNKRSNHNTSRNNKPSEIQILCNSFKLPANSSFDDFKKKYRQLCKKYHPDIYGSDDMMKAINIAYERVEIYFGKK